MNRQSVNQIQIVNVKIMVHNCEHRTLPYFTIAVAKPHKPGPFESKHFIENQTGRYMVQNLIEALTQDDVLKAITPAVRLTVSSFLIAVALLSGAGCPAATAQITPKQAVYAIIGESEAEGPSGMLAVACAIRNRGTLQGVYGLHAYRVTHHLYSLQTLHMAQIAWTRSVGEDVTGGATGWGSASDIHSFQKTNWWRHMRITAHIGHHWFYKEII